MSNYSPNIRNILIIRLSSIGDIVLSTHIPRLLKNKFSESNIQFVVNKEFKDLIKFNGYIDEVLEYNKKSKTILNAISIKDKYDLVIDLQNNSRSKKIVSLLKFEKLLKYNKNRISKIKMVYLKNIPKNYKSIPERYLEVLSDYLKNDNEANEVWTKKNYTNKKYIIPLKSGVKNRILIAPGASFFTKTWPIKKFSNVISLLNDKYEIALIGGKNEMDLANELEKKHSIINYVGKLRLDEVAEMMDNYHALITNDTGLMHIASARKLPLVLIYGSSIKEFGFLPYRNKYELLETNISCRPCSHIGKKSCPKKHLNCLNLIDEKMVIQALNKILGN